MFRFIACIDGASRRHWHSRSRRRRHPLKCVGYLKKQNIIWSLQFLEFIKICSKKTAKNYKQNKYIK
jgi:hypothetical protein